ncbi:CaiB/BaiF CoA transferase family protein [Phycicoccus avicenniae]|uniref:CaiB/BaiF CoA transferase family protein n=1 Tax=Phycicoccus avicenniae TaxID=2828860 RepID=UPI002010ED5A|nr:CoA transferase [Phycicoccus avicenniae]
MPGPLDGVVVVDLSRALAGPHATMVLADLGARVVKVEPPGGDDTRGWGPPFAGPDDDPVSPYWLAANRNKESVVLDLRSDEGRRTLTRLVRHGDVLVENFRPGVLDRLGFDVATLRALSPRLVVLSISGFGHDGPEGGRAGYDQVAQGEGGLMSVTGSGPDDPQRVGVPVADLVAGLHGALGVAAALREREVTGRGRVVRTSLLAAAVGLHAFQGTAYTVTGQVPRARGNHHPTLAPYGLFRAADGPVQVAIGSARLWDRFAAAFGLDAADPRLATNTDRVVHHAHLVEVVEAAFAAWTADALLDRLDELGVPAGRVRTMDEVYDWEQTRSQGLVVEVDHPVLGPTELPGPPLRFDEDGRGGRTRHEPPPRLDAHGASVRAWLDAMDEGG